MQLSLIIPKIGLACIAQIMHLRRKNYLASEDLPSMSLMENHPFFYLEALDSKIIYALLTGDKNNLLAPIKNFHFAMLQMITGLHLKEIMMGVMK